MPEPNLSFQRARQALPSPSAPGEEASRQELADLVNTWMFDKHRRSGCLTRHYVGKLERGEVLWPNADYREALRAVLGVEWDRDLGFQRPRRAGSAATVNRKGFIRTAAGVVTAIPLAELALHVQAAGVPPEANAADIVELRNVARTFQSWDHHYGGGLVRDAVVAQLRYSVTLLEKSRCPRRLHDDLYAAVGLLAHAAAFYAACMISHRRPSSTSAALIRSSVWPNG